ncbi:MAG: tail fiber domain-containing protein [bacterium]|nr:tail fiber domain-containing protein [bacterium]
MNGVTIGKGGGNIGSNTAVGTSVLPGGTGTYNTGIGYFALNSISTTGVYNTASGAHALRYNTTASYNTGTGYGALYANRTGNYNTATGFGALGGSSNTSGDYNTANGVQALLNNIGSSNTAIGYQALGGYPSGNTGSSNTAGGYTALRYNTTGYNNTAFGYSSLNTNTTGYLNTALGYGADVASGALTNATAIGNGASVTASNRVRVGNTAVTQIGGQVAWSTLSDGRQKENIMDYAHGLDFIMKLRPVTFNLRADTTKVPHSGFIAQEVESTGIPFYGLNKPANVKDFYSLNYSEFVVPLVNSVKELKAENEKLKADNDELRVRIEKIEEKIK